MAMTFADYAARKQKQRSSVYELAKLKLQKDLELRNQKALYDYKQKSQPQKPTEQDLTKQNLADEVTYDEQNQSITLPGQKYDRTPTGNVVQRNLSEPEKQKIFMTFYDKLIQSGKQPPEFMRKAYERAVMSINKTKPEKPGAQKKYGKETNTHQFYTKVINDLNSGVYHNKKEALGDLYTSKKQFDAQGIDMDYVIQNVEQNVPNDFQYVKGQEGKRGILGFSFLGGQPERPGLYKKFGQYFYRDAKGKWNAATPDMIKGAGLDIPSNQPQSAIEQDEEDNG